MSVLMFEMCLVYFSENSSFTRKSRNFDDAQRLYTEAFPLSGTGNRRCNRNLWSDEDSARSSCMALIRESNPGHIGGKQVLSPLCYRCSSCSRLLAAKVSFSHIYQFSNLIYYIAGPANGQGRQDEANSAL